MKFTVRGRYDVRVRVAHDGRCNKGVIKIHGIAGRQALSAR